MSLKKVLLLSICLGITNEIAPKVEDYDDEGDQRVVVYAAVFVNVQPDATPVSARFQEPRPPIDLALVLREKQPSALRDVAAAHPPSTHDETSLDACAAYPVVTRCAPAKTAQQKQTKLQQAQVVYPAAAAVLNEQVVVVVEGVGYVHEMEPVKPLPAPTEEDKFLPMPMGGNCEHGVPSCVDGAMNGAQKLVNGVSGTVVSVWARIRAKLHGE